MTFEHIRHIETQDTGGGIVLDFITLRDGTILVIGDESIGHYAGMEAFEDGEALATIYRV